MLVDNSSNGSNNKGEAIIIMRMRGVYMIALLVPGVGWILTIAATAIEVSFTSITSIENNDILQSKTRIPGKEGVSHCGEYSYNIKQ